MKSDSAGDREVLVQADRLHKVYHLYPSPWWRLVELLGGPSHHKDLVAVEDVSFELKRGEGLGIVGQNGAGKSTLLKMIAGALAPSSGSVATRGRLASILELGSGFHPEFSGRQNLRLNAAMLGLGETEVKAREPAIVEFSELGEFIDRPLKTYSTGMAMRLGFAVAAQVDPDVLIVDEALSVGDGYFQKKCMDRIVELVQSGTTLLFCTHGMYYLSAFCERALWMKDGRAEAFGPTHEVVAAYERYLLERGRQGAAEIQDEPAGDVGEPARLTHVSIVDPPPCSVGDSLGVRVEWTTTDVERRFHVGIGLDRSDDLQVAALGTHWDGHAPFGGQETYLVDLEIDRMALVQGTFKVTVFLMDQNGLHVFDRRVIEPAFEIPPSEEYRTGLVELEHRWLSNGEAVTR